MKTLQDFGLSPEAILRHATCPDPKPRRAGRGPCFYRHPDLADLPLAERKKIIAKRWRLARKLAST